MKIQCDVCNGEEASVFCSADEATLCGGCDRRVHHANKLASKHVRFSLHRPASAAESPRCDICQERRAILFCQEDRAILCRECDVPIHKANEHTQKHNRFLLTGVRLSSSSEGCDFSTDSTIKSSVSNQLSNPSSTDKESLPSASTHRRADIDHCVSQENSVSMTSSISEYLMETLPGWRVDDFLDPSSSPNGLCKFLDHDVGNGLYRIQSEDLATWVPQAPIQSSHIRLSLLQTGVVNGLLNGAEKAQDVMKISREWNEDGFMVPQISPPPLKKSRQFW